MARIRVERERLMNGNWKIRPVAGMFFRREWFPIVDQAPVCDLAILRMTPRSGSKGSSGRGEPR